MDPDSLAAGTGRSIAPVPALDSVRNISEARAAARLVRADGTSHRAARTDLSNAPAAAHSLAATHSRVHRSATSAGTLGVAGYRLSEILAAQCPTAEALQRAAEVRRLDIAARPVLER